MKRKRLLLALAAMLAAGGLWLGRSVWRPDQAAFHKSNTTVGVDSPSERTKTSQMTNPPSQGHTLAPPDPTRRFREFTPEQRVEFARKGHGPGG